jgi:hypothetical protein
VNVLFSNLDELREDVRLGEERIERLRQELNDLKRKRDDPVSRNPPALIHVTNDIPHHVGLLSQ